uniref:Astacin domain-containing protein n=1 Tax=Meloidogyne hapla TaxID=6305 RepID=A0A1I8BXX1_MELHA
MSKIYYSNDDYYPGILALKWDMMLGYKGNIETNPINERIVFWSKIGCQNEGKVTNTKIPTIIQNSPDQITMLTTNYQNLYGTKVQTSKYEKSKVQTTESTVIQTTELLIQTCPLERNPLEYNNYGC